MEGKFSEITEYDKSPKYDLGPNQRSCLSPVSCWLCGNILISYNPFFTKKYQKNSANSVETFKKNSNSTEYLDLEGTFNFITFWLQYDSLIYTSYLQRYSQSHRLLSYQSFPAEW